MPLYEYQCQQCLRITEKIQKFSDSSLTTCPHCGGTLERTLTAPAVQFKGSGWYKDLYSSAKPQAPAKGGESAPAASGEAAKPAADKPSPAPAAPSPSSAPASSGPSKSGS